MCSGEAGSENMDRLLQDLSREKRFRDEMEDANSDIEKCITDLEAYVTHLDTVTDSAEDNEWKVRYECQTALNVQLSDLKATLLQDIAETRWKFHQGAFPDAMNFNLNLLTEAEQRRLVKQMEDILKKCCKVIQDSEYKIEAENKAFTHYDAMRRKYRGELKKASKKSVEMKKLEELTERREAAGSPPFYSSSYISWLDSNALDNPVETPIDGKPVDKTMEEMLPFP